MRSLLLKQVSYHSRLSGLERELHFLFIDFSFTRVYFMCVCYIINSSLFRSLIGCFSGSRGFLVLLVVVVLLVDLVFWFLWFSAWLFWSLSTCNSFCCQLWLLHRGWALYWSHTIVVDRRALPSVLFLTCDHQLIIKQRVKFCCPCFRGIFLLSEGSHSGI